MLGVEKRHTKRSSNDLETIDRGLSLVNLTLVILVALIWLSISYDRAMLIAWYKKGAVSLPLLNQAVLRRLYRIGS